MGLPSTPEEIVAMPLRELALAVLAQLVRATEVNRKNFIAGVYATMPPRRGVPSGLYGRSMDEEPAAAHALSEAWDWLLVNGLLSSDPIQGRSFYFVTRRGRRVAADPAAVDEEW
jgi:hypothetical protein